MASGGAPGGPGKGGKPAAPPTSKGLTSAPSRAGLPSPVAPRSEESPVPPAALRALGSPLPHGPAPCVRPASQAPDRALQDAWVARLKARDPDALREVVAAFSERLTAVVTGVLKDRDLVDDVVQETFTKAWYRIDAFQGDASLYTWLYRIAINGSKDKVKRQRRRPTGSLEDLGPEPGLAAPSTPPLEGLARRELRLAVREAMARLPQRFRAVLALREIEGLPYQEIASVLSLSLGTVESRLFRARQRLGVLLARRLTPGAGGTSGA